MSLQVVPVPVDQDDETYVTRLPTETELRAFSRDVLRRERREAIENCLALLKRIGETK